MFFNKSKNKYFWWVIIGVAALLVVFMHVYKICDIPFGLNVDEVAAAYDALNIARYGVDRHLNSYPVYFTNYGDGQNALYIYLTAALIKIFGISKYVIRATIVMASFVGAYFGFRYCSQAWKNRRMDALFLILYAILPVFTMTQRFGLESHLMLAAGIASVYFLARAMESQKTVYYFLAGVVCGVTLYTYALAYIVLPICLLVLIAYGIRMKSFSLKRVAAFVIPLGILAAPLIMVQVVNMFDLPAFRIGPFTITKLLTYRSDEVGIGTINIWENFKNVLSNTLLYDDRTYNSTSLFGNMYYVSIPFIVLGIGKAVADAVKSVKEKVFDYSVPMLAWLLGQLVIGVLLTGNSTPNNTRMIGIFGCLLYFLVVGLSFVWDLCKHIWLRRGFFTVMTVVYSIGFICFAKYYFTEYNEAAYPFNWLFYETYDDIGEFVEENEGAEFLDRATNYPFNYVYYLLEFEVNPYDFNLPVNGKEKYLNHDINEYTYRLSYASNYVVLRNDESSQEVLNDLGYVCYPAGKFYFYVSPLENFEEQLHAKEMFYLDEVSLDDDHLRISGWGINAASNQIYASFVIKTEDEMYVAEIDERADVVSSTGNEALLNSGYEFALPLTLFEESDSVQLCGCDESGTETILYSWTRKE